MKAENKIINVFFELKEPKLYYNQIREHANISHSSLQNTLKKMIENNLLGEEKTKSNKFYHIKDKKTFELRFSEISWQKFNNLNIGIKNPLRNFLKETPQEIFTIILFGSAARKEEQKGSDIDLLIVTNKKTNIEHNKKNAEITSKYTISITNCTIKQYIENKDDLIIQARKTGFPIYKEQNFYEIELNEYPKTIFR